MNLNNSIWYKNDKISLDKVGGKYSPIVEGILESRGVSEEDAESYLNPTLEDLYDPFELKGMKIAQDRMLDAIKNKEKVVIYGDYDVDGITSVSILLKTAQVLNYEFDYYIPDRHVDGYGLSLSAVEKLKEMGTDLVVTVDCGITSVKECDLATELGMDVIITDHHECQSEIPRALAVLNPKQDDCNYKFDMLAGVGIAFKLAQALIGDDFDKHIENFIAIAAFGTIADIAPITDENRIMCKFGLKAITSGKNLGIKRLIEKTKLDGKQITCGHVGFSLAPKINAAGRIGNPKLGVELLTSYDGAEIEKLAEELMQLNIQRQEIEKGVLEEALEYIENEINFEKEKIIIVRGYDWNTGIIGIVASRIVEKYHRPTIIFNISDGIAKGSARSISGFSIFGALNEFKDLFIKFGGHDQAAGLSLDEENLDTLREKINGYAFDMLDDRLLTPSFRVDATLSAGDITHELLEEIEKLEPFGHKNPKPVFRCNDMSIENKLYMGKNSEYIKFKVNDGIRVFDCMNFRETERMDKVKRGDVVDMIFNLDMNRFRGLETVQLMMKDFRVYRGSFFENTDELAMYKDGLSNKLSYLLKGDGVSFKKQGKEISIDKVHEDVENAKKTLILIDTFEGIITFYNKIYDNITKSTEFNFNVVDKVSDITVCINPTEIKLHDFDNVLVIGDLFDFNSDSNESLNVLKTTGLDERYTYNTIISAIPDINKLRSVYISIKEKSYEGKFEYLEFMFCVEILENAKLIERDAESPETYTIKPVTGKTDMEKDDLFISIRGIKDIMVEK